MTFQLIGPTNALVTLPMRYSPEYFPDESDIIVLGCQINNLHVSAYLENKIDALFVFVKQKQHYKVYSRRPAVPLRCPVQK